MENGAVEKGVCSSESVNGGPDMSCKDCDSLSVDHLVVMVHGILGRLATFYINCYFDYRTWSFTGFFFFFSIVFDGSWMVFMLFFNFLFTLVLKFV